MIRLDADTSLEVVLGGAISTNQLPVHVWFHDVPNLTKEDFSEPRGDVKRSDTNDTTAVTVCDAAPQRQWNRVIDAIVVHNADTASATVTLRTDNGSSEKVITVKTLTAGQTFWYEGGRPPEVF